MKIKWLLFLLYFNSSFSQTFIAIDNDTHEFIEDVNYSLFLNRKLVFKSITKNKELTQITPTIPYDSISFTKIDYHTIGFQKKNIDSIIYLSKKITYLDEVVVNAKKDNILILGENNRFVKKESRAFSKELNYGIIFKNESKEKILINKIAFYTEKIFYKTAYKINIYEVKETLRNRGNQFIERGNLVYSSDTLFIYKNGISKNEIDITSELFLEPTVTLMGAIELLDYYDDNNKIINLNTEYSTKLKFQLSEKENYYSKLSDFYTNQLSENLINCNLMINYDFANHFFKKPHRSSLVTPAILLYGKKI